MVKRTPPSAASASGQHPRTTPSEGRRLGAREWLGGFRLSGFMVIMLGLVALAVGVLAPTVGTYLSQREKLSAMQSQLHATQEQIDELQQKTDRSSDPAYIMTQARERLYYVKPGQTIYLVNNDLPADQQPADASAVSTTLQQTQNDWMSQLVHSIVVAGSSYPVTEPTAPGTGSTPTP